MRASLSLLIAAALLFTACAKPSGRVMTAATRGQDEQQVVKDRAECEADAGQREATGASAAAGLGIGAVVGGALGALAGLAVSVIAPRSAATLVATGAAMGAVMGGARGSAEAAAGNIDLVNRAYAVCMEARGYAVR